MNEQLVARIWDAVATRTLNHSRHFLERILERSMPGVSDVRFVICDDDPEVIEDNRRPHGLTGKPSCLIWGHIDDRRAHILCSYPPEPVIITAYWPDTEPDEWEDDFKRRKSTS